MKEAADIVEIVSAYTDLRRAGERYTGLCPFHEERTPSFSVDPREKLYHCFGCGVGGDVIRFVEEKEGLGFPEAVEALADRYGVELERESEDPRAEEARKRRARLGELLERTAQFYAAYLWESQEAGEGAGVPGVAGAGGGGAAGVRGRLRAERLGPGADARPAGRVRRGGAAAAGLVQKGQKGGHYDRFRARIMFPVRDPRGAGAGVRGAGAAARHEAEVPELARGRAVPEEPHALRDRPGAAAIAKGGRAVVVEGYTDVLAAHQAGIEEAVAVMGTAITPEQLKQLARYAEEVVLALDADRAGREAMLRAQRVAGSRKLRLRVAAMPAGEDPADMLQGGASASG